jgi:hypothetical protein
LVFYFWGYADIHKGQSDQVARYRILVVPYFPLAIASVVWLVYRATKSKSLGPWMSENLVKEGGTFNPEVGIPIALIGVVVFFVVARIAKFLIWGV